MRLPASEDDGALPRERVILGLVDQGVAVSRDGSWYCLSKGNECELQELPESVGRRLIQYLCRKFGIEIVRMYVPHDQKELGLN